MTIEKAAKRSEFQSQSNLKMQEDRAKEDLLLPSSFPITIQPDKKSQIKLEINQIKSPKELDKFVEQTEGQEIVDTEIAHNDRVQIENVREKLAFDKMMHAQDKQKNRLYTKLMLKRSIEDKFLPDI